MHKYVDHPIGDPPPPPPPLFPQNLELEILALELHKWYTKKEATIMQQLQEPDERKNTIH